MITNLLTSRLRLAAIAALATFTLQTPGDACTRALYTAKDGTVLTGRSMDWGEDMHSNMWVLPAGMKRDGMGGANSTQWESKYGSLVVSAYDIGSSDGINEKGLTVNMLALVESDYGKQFKVLTNSPTYDQQLAIMEY